MIDTEREDLVREYESIISELEREVYKQGGEIPAFFRR